MQPEDLHHHATVMFLSFFSGIYIEAMTHCVIRNASRYMEDISILQVLSSYSQAYLLSYFMVRFCMDLLLFYS